MKDKLTRLMVLIDAVGIPVAWVATGFVIAEVLHFYWVIIVFTLVGVGFFVSSFKRLNYLKLNMSVSEETPEVSMEQLMSWERNLPKATEVILLVFKPLALYFSEIRDLMVYNVTNKDISYKYHFLSRSAAEKVPEIYSVLSDNGRNDLKSKVYFVKTVVNTDSALLNKLSEFLVDGVWIGRSPDNKLKGFIVYRTTDSVYGRELKSEVIDDLHKWITEGTSSLFQSGDTTIEKNIEVNIKIGISIKLLTPPHPYTYTPAERKQLKGRDSERKQLKGRNNDH